MRIAPRWLVVLALFATSGCKGRDAAPKEVARPAAQTAAAEADALARANAAADRLSRTLRTRLLEAMAEGGPTSAMRVCAEEAQALTASIARETGVDVGRSSLRLRNPRNAPRPWVSAWLAAQGERKAAGVEGFARIEEGRARVLRPIVVEGPCVTCHGPAEGIPPEVAAVLRARYASDAATGYLPGDLRGALWAEVALR